MIFVRTIERSRVFKRDFKKHGQLDTALIEVLYLLANDEVLPEKYHDHDLTGNWQGYRECHLKPDLLLIYRRDNGDSLKLARLGSHSELFK